MAYLKSYFDEDVRLHNIYRYMDTLYNTQREKVQQISVEHTLRILGGRIGIVFYDVTTLYFESTPQPDDELRQAGFSKDGKMAESQIVLGLLVSQDGYPMSYSIFNGSQYEGRTIIPIIDDFVQRFKLTDFIVVADSGLMNTKNARAKKNAWNRNKGVERLRKAYAKGTLTKENVNKRGYNKFLDISKDHWQGYS